jgi:hypothetical protein
MQSIFRRFPTFDQVLPVFAVIALFTYGRTIYVFIFKVPAWLLFQLLGEILANLAYGLVLNLLESLLILSVFLLVTFLLPARFFKQHFTVYGTWLVVFILGLILIFLKYYSSTGPDFNQYIYLWMGTTLVMSIPVAYLGGRIPFLKKAALWFSDRVIVLLFIFLPATLVSILALIVRNIP